MATIRNTTKRPLKVRLPGGKTMHLGPAGSGQVKPKALDSPALQALISSGDVVVEDSGHSSPGGGGGSNKGISASGGHGGGPGLFQSGDR